jgi:hypothetical protein
LRERLDALRRRFARMPAVGEAQAFLLVAVLVGVVAAPCAASVLLLCAPEPSGASASSTTIRRFL